MHIIRGVCLVELHCREAPPWSDDQVIIAPLTFPSLTPATPSLHQFFVFLFPCKRRHERSAATHDYGDAPHLHLYMYGRPLSICTGRATLQVDTNGSRRRQRERAVLHCTPNYYIETRKFVLVMYCTPPSYFTATH